jgi:hypothetical protein
MLYTEETPSIALSRRTPSKAKLAEYRGNGTISILETTLQSSNEDGGPGDIVAKNWGTGSRCQVLINYECLQQQEEEGRRGLTPFSNATDTNRTRGRPQNDNEGRSANASAWLADWRTDSSSAPVPWRLIPPFAVRTKQSFASF